MRVLQVIPSLSSVHGGPSEAIRVMEHALLSEGVQNETCTTNDDGFGRRVKRRLGVRLLEEGHPRWYFRKDTEFYKCSWKFLPWILRHVRDYDILHIHALFTFTSIAAAYAARRAGVPYVIRPLGTLNLYGLRMRRPILKKLSLRWIEGPIIRRSAAVHVTTEAEQHQVKTLGLPAKYVLVPLALLPSNGCSASPIGELLPQLANRRIILFMSRLDPVKNIEALLAAFSKVTVHDPALRLVIAGAGESHYVAHLRNQAAELGLVDSVSWLGHVSGELKIALLRGAFVFVLPSFSENFGMAVAEALTAGLPCVVGSGVGLAAQIAKAEAGLSVDSTALEIAEAIECLLIDVALRARMARNAKDLAQREFSTSVLGQRLRALYEAVLTGCACGERV